LVWAGTDLISAISANIKQASTQALDISFNELLDMSETKELDIAPDYQRLFRWTEGQQSRFIESLLLEMPVPPIFVIEEESGRYQLIAEDRELHLLARERTFIENFERITSQRVEMSCTRFG
jgi:hypothetical protein